jgi:hypothetical protein
MASLRLWISKFTRFRGFYSGRGEVLEKDAQIFEREILFASARDGAGTAVRFPGLPISDSSEAVKQRAGSTQKAPLYSFSQPRCTPDFAI